MVQQYPGWAALFDKLQDPCLRAKDVSRILQISSRQLNDWEQRGMLKTLFERPQSRKAEGWRQFKILDLVALAILKKAKNFGISVTSFKENAASMFSFNENLVEFIPHIVYGLKVYFYTDLEGILGYYGCEPGEDGIHFSDQQLQGIDAMTLIHINPLVDHIFLHLQHSDFEPQKGSNGQYRFEINGVPLALENLFEKQTPKQDR
jgi:DNA-binding transcriptional MerR regulator